MNWLVRQSHQSLLLCGLLAMLVIVLASCGTAIPDPHEADLRIVPDDLSWVTLNDLRVGRRLYVENCGACHRLKPPEEQTGPEWSKSFAEMRKRVHLTSAEENRIIAYLRTFAQRSSRPDSPP